ncbi:MAG: DnaJ domain-containing protein [Microthrixaceae bacterium]|nr:DnaJ domain-containing protein [Microthrixaceae bacterium]
MSTNSSPAPAGPDKSAPSERRSKKSDLGFPGGRANLPRMRSNGAPDLKPRVDRPVPENKPVFQEYFSVESLFSSADTNQEVTRARPWTVLGVAEDAEWSEIQAAHRRMAKQLHPDRWVRATEPEQRWAEEAIRRINEAMADLRVMYFGVQA